MPILSCSKCGQPRELVQKSYYEAVRLNKNVCFKCRLPKKKGSKYNTILKKEQIINNWVIVGDEESDYVVKGNGCKVQCRCLLCGSIHGIVAIQLITGRSKQCRSCTRGAQSGNWRGIGKLPSTSFTTIRLRAKSRNIQFSVSKEYLSNLFDLQEGKCALSGIDIDFDPPDGRNLGNSNGTASLDRIDSSIGYIEGNVQWVHKQVNIMKNEYSTQRFLELCSAIHNHHHQHDTDRIT